METFVQRTQGKHARSTYCVANKAKHRIFKEMCSEIAQANPKPSYVEVPLPSSSMMIREFLVAA